MTRTLYKVLGDTLSRIDWNDDVREDRLKDLSWVSGDYGEVGFHGYGSVWCYLSENPDLDGACIEDEITIARKQWRRDQRRAAIRALDMDERDCGHLIAYRLRRTAVP